MKKVKLIHAGIFLFLFISIGYNRLHSQCSPAFAETCVESNVFCSLSELNGYTCFNGSSVEGHCYPLCPAGGRPDNTTWWAFVSQGGQPTLTLHVGACTENGGVQWGLWANCACSESIFCKYFCYSSGESAIEYPDLVPCKTYYLWIDGCNGDLCDFTINTSGGATPTLAPLGFINNNTTSLINVCEGACNASFFVNPQPGGCEPIYEWTLDGNAIGESATQIKLDFPDIGNFQLCVTAYIGNPASGSICDQEGPRCASVRVNRLTERMGAPRVLCVEATKPAGYRWHSQIVTGSGNYKQEFQDANCCKYDSVVDFIVLDYPDKPDVYYLTCNEKPYVDMLGRPYTPCKNHYEIVFPKSTSPYKCDSSVILTAVNVNYSPRWNVHCLGNQVELSPNISIIKPCSAGETYQFEYKWYLKNDPSKTVISSDERLIVDAITEDYCVDVDVRVELSTEMIICSKTFCESINEGDFLPFDVPLNGDKIICVNGTGIYWADTSLKWKVTDINWSVDGGTITKGQGSSSIEVRWMLSQDDTGRVCLVFNSNCGERIERCIDVTFANGATGKDFRQIGKIAKLNSPFTQPGTWSKISGPGNATFEDPNNPKSRVRVDQYGKYCFEWTPVDTSCFSKYRICVDFYRPVFEYYDYPHNTFERRDHFSESHSDLPLEIFSPSLIQSNGKSFVAVDGAANSKMIYTWIDIYGKLINQNNLFVEHGVQKINIESPIQSGMYFLVIELNGISSVQKVCVVE